MNTVCFTKALIFSCLMLSALDAAPASKPKLTSPIIKWLDNKPFALDAVALGDVLHVRREIRKIQFGVQDRVTKQFVGSYTFDGQLRTLRWLADYERKLTQEFNEHKRALDAKYVDGMLFDKDVALMRRELEKALEEKITHECDTITRSISDPIEFEYQMTKIQRELRITHETMLVEREDEIRLKHVKQKDLYRKELHEITDVYKQKMSALIPCLKMAIRDFIIANEPFALKMEGTKSMMLKVVEEFCLKYRRPYSFLLEWSKVEEGQEAEAFKKTMTGCTALDQFCTDLTDFLEALYYSCEKARAEFEEKEKAKKK